MIGGPAQHDPVQPHPVGVVQQGLGLIQIGDPAVDRNVQLGPLALQPPHQSIVQGRHVAVLLGRQALEPGLARMDDEDLDPDGGAGVHRGEQADLRVLVVDPDPAFDRGGHGHGLPDRRHTVGDQRRLAHQTGAEPARLNPVRGTADVQIDLVIAVGFTDPGRLGQLFRIGPAQLQGDRMFDRVKPQQMIPIPMQHRRRRHHLRIE